VKQNKEKRKQPKALRMRQWREDNLKCMVLRSPWFSVTLFILLWWVMSICLI